MNRLPSSDSQYSLDEAARPYENAGMEVLHLRRVDPDRNMARFYSLTIEPTLFGTASLVREWGRIGTSGRRRVDLFEDEAGARYAYLRLAQQKTRRGYIAQ
jgi:predicted DNA-binding WGR domain protein